MMKLGVEYGSEIEIMGFWVGFQHCNLLSPAIQTRSLDLVVV
jgi:hypothetical protein